MFGRPSRVTGDSRPRASEEGRRSRLRVFAEQLRGRSRDAFARRVGIDPRALAAFRISLGFLFALDLLLRSRDLVAFYTDSGVLPRAVLRESSPLLARVSLHALSGAAWAQGVLFTLAAGLALALLVGYRTRVATAGSLVLLFSLHARNPLVLNGGDTLLVHLLFWGMFLPLGERWSLDARRGGWSFPPRQLVTSVASAALLVQVVLVYVVNATLKLRGDLWLGGEAVQYVFSLDKFTVLLGDVLANYPDLLELFAHLWLAMVVSSVLLVALTGRARAAFVALFVGAHLGMALTLRIGLFPLISVAGLLPFLPPVVWDTFESAVPNSVSISGPSAISSDSVVAAVSSVSAVAAVSSDSVVAAVSSVSAVLPLFSVSVVPTILETLSRWARRLRTPVVACLLVGMVGWNAAVLGVVDTGGAVTTEDTPWNMFAPDPMRTDGWYVMPGELASGEEVDAFHQRPIRWDRPPDVAQSYPNDRWRKYLKNVRWSEYPSQRRAFAGYLCDRWNRNHDDELVRLSVVYVAQPTRFDGPEPTRRVQIGNYSCSVVGSSGH